MTFDWTNVPPGTKFAEVDGKPAVMLPDGRCLSGWTGKLVSSGRVANEGVLVSREEFDRLVSSANE